MRVLVERHSAMVLGVCRRALEEHAEAEDAAQAVFLVLWKKAAELRAPSIVGWLHRTALFVCQNAIRSRQSRRNHEERAARMNATAPLPSSIHWPAVREVLDEELNSLPEKYRVPLILFHLQGLSLAQIAEQMSVKASTVGTWLGRAREQLAERLTKRGITIGAALLAMGLTSVAEAGAVPATFVSSTVTAASLYGAGHISVAGGLSASTSALANGCLTTTKLLTPLKIAMTGLLSCLSLGLLVFAVLSRSDRSPPPASVTSSQSTSASDVGTLPPLATDMQADEEPAGTPPPVEEENDPDFGGVTGRIILVDPNQPQQVLEELQNELKTLPPSATPRIGAEPLPDEHNNGASSLPEAIAPGTEPQPLLDQLQQQIESVDPVLVGPPARGIGGVFVYLRQATVGMPPQMATIPTKRLVVDTVAGVFVPHTFLARTGQSVVFKNGSTISVNVHTTPVANPARNFILMPMNRVGMAILFATPESQPIPIVDDLNPKASCYALVLDHPYAAVTDAQGHFRIAHLPVGTHAFRVWHESLGYLDRDYQITVAGGQAVSLPPLKVPVKK